MNTLFLFLHVLGSALWTGGLLLLWRFTSKDCPPEHLRPALARFRAPSLTALLVQALTGAHLAVPYFKMGGFTFEDRYSAHLMLKIALFVLSVALALGMGLWSRRDVPPAKLRWGVRCCAALALALLLLGADVRP